MYDNLPSDADSYMDSSWHSGEMSVQNHMPMADMMRHGQQLHQQHQQQQQQHQYIQQQQQQQQQQQHQQNKRKLQRRPSYHRSTRSDKGLGANSEKPHRRRLGQPNSSQSQRPIMMQQQTNGRNPYSKPNGASYDLASSIRHQNSRFSSTQRTPVQSVPARFVAEEMSRPQGSLYHQPQQYHQYHHQQQQHLYTASQCVPNSGIYTPMTDASYNSMTGSSNGMRPQRGSNESAGSGLPGIRQQQSRSLLPSGPAGMMPVFQHAVVTQAPNVFQSPFQPQSQQTHHQQHMPLQKQFQQQQQQQQHPHAPVEPSVNTPHRPSPPHRVK
eukprot:TRINITY_DN31088_c0_g2_i1.p1 TRINITY_DN31088_c0_g2~~TRINITY_DN31088_c0_g2_i1.p1  ORF type:complete len:326 (-),score=121.65 TRINITY_DN31088_c0_g2_i1:465-1442(-)